MNPDPSFPVKHSDPAPAVTHAWVLFDTPGVARIGPYERAVKYHVESVEAERLVSVKGFTYTTAPDAALPSEEH